MAHESLKVERTFLDWVRAGTEEEREVKYERRGQSLLALKIIHVFILSISLKGGCQPMDFHMISVLKYLIYSVFIAIFKDFFGLYLPFHPRVVLKKKLLFFFKFQVGRAFYKSA